MQIGNKRQLNADDLWELQSENQAAAAYAAFSKQYGDHGKSVARAIWHTYGVSIVLCGLAFAISTACTLFSPLVLRHVIDAFAKPEIDTQDLMIWLGAFFVSLLVNTTAITQMNMHLEFIGLRLTVSLKSLLFQKAMRKSVSSKNDASAVDLSNVYSSDVSSILWATYVVNEFLILPVQIVGVVYLLYDVLGYAVFAGFGVIGLSILATSVLSKFSGKAFGNLMAKKDVRMRLIKEVFGAIQIVKLNAWEAKFADKVHSLRARELSALGSVKYLEAISSFLSSTFSLLVPTVSIAVYTLVMDEVLTASKVFTAMALFNVLRQPLRVLPFVVQTLVEAKVSLARISEFLETHESDLSNVTRAESPLLGEAGVAISVEDGCFGWSRDTPLLQDVYLKIKKGDLVVIHGPVGAGKSSLCYALLGEMEKMAGCVAVRGRVAYYSQQPWIQNMTIRDNILFGKAYDHQRYQKVLDSCGLLPDLAQLPGGDATEIGQKGVNLSGGQQARLCLARACYSDADVFILDSPLAAVDAVVQSEVFSKCICGLLQDKTILLVTHSPEIIASEAVNYKIFVEGGKLKGEAVRSKKPRGLFAHTKLSPSKLDEAYAHEVDSQDNTSGAGRLVEDEERNDGRVSTDVFAKYFHFLGGFKVFLLLFLIQASWQGCQIGSDLWLSYWTGEKLGHYNKDEAAYNMTIYAGLGAGATVMIFVRAILVVCAGIRASRNLFDVMTRSLFQAPLRFFDANPIGRIVNRYGGDMMQVDVRLPSSYSNLFVTLFSTCCQLGTAVYIVKFTGVLILPLAFLYVKAAKFYLAPSREIARLQKVSSSPVLSHVTQVEEGVVVVRAFGSECVDLVIRENFKRIDENSRVWVAEAAINMWFQMAMQLIGCGVVIVIVSGLVYFRDYLSPGIVGLTFTYALNIESGLDILVRYWSNIEIGMVSPERILEYAAIPAEGGKKTLVVEPPAQWPRQGSITFDKVAFSYKEGAPAVLKGVSFRIQNNEKIGIVGRTGAGKSSLTMALFRINELDSGRIVIDGEDISSMPLHSLRSRLSIIPQTPVLFKGTLRAYMDPFNEYSDADIWSVLEKVEMKEQIGALENQLSYELSENGENFSVGERQMLCMARALLVQSRIVIMDEATASIDHATESKLQTMIARELNNATVLTIAHRLTTVLDSDRIMVLSDGNVVEFDTPQNLVKNPHGVFYELVKEGGYLDRLL
ncbi:Atp-binding protein, partial [Globisporangium splendens]